MQDNTDAGRRKHFREKMRDNSECNQFGKSHNCRQDSWMEQGGGQFYFELQDEKKDIRDKISDEIQLKSLQQREEK